MCLAILAIGKWLQSNFQFVTARSHGGPNWPFATPIQQLEANFMWKIAANPLISNQ